MMWVAPWLAAVNVWLVSYGIGVATNLSRDNNASSATAVALMMYGFVFFIMVKVNIP